jgi:hypothetical protein
MGAGHRRGRSREGVAALFGRCRALGHAVANRARRPADPAALRAYFVTAFKVLPGLKVAFGDQLIRVYGNAAVNTGYYTFSYTKDGETKSLPARYSFTYVKSGERWLIVDHHSSAMPSPPK